MSNFYKDYDDLNRTTRVLENLSDIRRDYGSIKSGSNINKEQGDEFIVNHSSGKINFRKNTRKAKMKAALKGVIFVFIASLSGGITATILIENKYSSYLTEKPRYISGNGVYIGGKPFTSSSVIPKNATNIVAETVAPAVVGISNNADNFVNETINSYSGSGIIFDSNGYIVTSYRIIQGADKIMVKLPFNTMDSFQATVVGVDKNSDIAVIKIDAKDLPVAKFGEGANVRQGDVGIAIGNPFGQEYGSFITNGIISSINRKVKSKDSESGKETTYKIFQTDTEVYAGGYGGPLCNELGEVIGLLSSSIQPLSGMNFAISIDEVKKVINAINNSTEGPRLGFGIEGVTVNNVGGKGIKGFYVLDVIPGSGAEAAGIQSWDIIMEVAGEKINSKEEFIAKEETFRDGDIVPCKVWRNEKVFDVNIKVSAIE
ncbi:MAG: PDZ domain-containing protein [Clostridiales bacterium]|uniref:S1C family serine protease n=1 Tax=Clostridium sp. N3C TaxID=1776758 RepID=UPI00092DED25|nr:trypsin-like peptidase domain-containing protein [Clostridium sp. N3C]NLZ48353.1 PDZ domain-containing protein [Clostridiales bacterium]SCN23115.1 Serine protease Do-like HtrA [Clostridium sp. N3C]